MVGLRLIVCCTGAAAVVFVGAVMSLLVVIAWVIISVAVTVRVVIEGVVVFTVVS